MAEKSEVKETPQEAAAPSLQLLKETAELSDITAAAAPERVPQDSELKIEISDQGKPGSNSIQTMYENNVIDKTVSSVTAAPNATGATAGGASVAAESGGSAAAAAAAGAARATTDPPAELSNSHQRAVQTARVNKMRDHQSNIFPAGIMGCKENELPSRRRFLDAGEASQDNVGHLGNTPRKATTLKYERGRNPVLGTGMEMDGKRRATEDAPDADAGARVPPGGFTHRLW